MDGVCERCLEADPSRIDLISHKCLQQSLHANERKVKVVWSAESNRLERSSGRPATPPIRRMPRVSFLGEFVLCDRQKRCRGEKCTFPHSAKERDAWNAEKFGRTLETSSPRQAADFEGITGPEWPTLPPAQPVNRTSAGPPASAWSRPIQTQWQKQSGLKTVTNQQPSRPPRTHTQSVSSDVPAEELQSRPVHVLRKRCPSDPSGSSIPLLEASEAMSHQLLEHDPYTPRPVEEERPSFLSLSLAALLSTELSMGTKFNPFQASPRTREQVLARMEQSQQHDSSRWPDLYELGAKPYLSPVPSPSISHVPPLGTPVGITPAPQQPLQQPAGPSQSSQQSAGVAPTPTLPGGQTSTFPGGQTSGSPPTFPGGQTSTFPGGQTSGSPPTFPGGQTHGPPPTFPASQTHGPPPTFPGGQTHGPPPTFPGGQTHGPPPTFPGGQTHGPPSTFPGGQTHGPPPTFPGGQTHGPPSTFPGGQTHGPPPTFPGGQTHGPPPTFPGGQTHGPPPTFPGGQTHSPLPRHDYAAKATMFHARIREELRLGDIQVELTRGNYKEKLHKLLCWEEKAHVEILGGKCNGEYTLMLHQAGLKQPAWMTKESKPFHKRFGYLLGLDGDQIAYATQASEGAFIVHEGVEVKVDVLMENYSHTEERMYIALDERNLEKLKKLEILSVTKSPFTSPVKLKVEFELKHSYFNSLHNAVEQLPSEVIARIMPQEQEFVPNHFLQIPDVRKYSNYCSEDQLNALQAIAACPSNGPPVLVPGAFGTGKTRILATAAHYIFQEKSSTKPARVLVCTQQRASADTFLECYLYLMKPQVEEIYLIRDYGYRLPNLGKHYRTALQFQSYIERSSYRNRSNFLIITTCLTTLHLAKFLPRGFFTHILLDEGAQTREPEAVAPLSMAGRNTKIVIAGDQNQVGPAMLVLGQEAQKYGLADSLLERLHTLYTSLGKAAGHHCATLVTNFRCHGGILQLAGMFYDLALRCIVPQSLAHPAAPYPLLFCCSSIDDKVQSIDSTMNEQEAEIALKLVAEFARQWPNSWGRVDLSQFCFMSPTRSQLTVTNRLIGELKLYQLYKVRKLPTYDVQGREFRALFLSTSEPTNKAGATRNPTKSIGDRYVFNTAITRAQSLVVAVGNPFMLLRMERHMVQKYGEKGKCWSNYLKFCLDHGTLTVHDSLRVSGPVKSRCIQKLQKLVGEHLSRSSSDIWRAEEAAEASVRQQHPPPPPRGRHLGERSPPQPKAMPAAMDNPSLSVPRRQTTRQPPPPSTRHPPPPSTRHPPPPSSRHPPPPSTHHPPPPSSRHPPPPSTHHPPPPSSNQPPFQSIHYPPPQSTHHPPPPPTHYPPIPPSNQPPPLSIHYPPLPSSNRPPFQSTHYPPPQSTHHPPPPLPSGISPKADTGNLRDGTSPPQHQPPIPEYSADVHGLPHTPKLDREYDVKKRLGKGGFGVVYHVKNKVDRAEYALKIIKLPSKKRDQDKVMREAEVLARLDHQKIVRYYTSWIEKAPPGWSGKKVWAALKSSESIPFANQSPYPTMSAVDDSSPPTTPSSANTPSDSTDTSVGNVAAESSTTDSLVEFKDDNKPSNHKPREEAATVHARPREEAAKGRKSATVAPVISLLPDPPTCLFIQTELCREHTLRHWLIDNIRNRARKNMLNYFDQILEAVVYIHEKGLVHRDLKPSNIFFSRDGEDNLKVGDFGLVTGNIAVDPPAVSPAGPGPEGQTCSSVAGTHFYMSPEQMAGVRIPQDQIQKVDIFALGVTFLELCCPFSTDMERFKVLTDMRSQKFPRKLTDNLPNEAELIRTLVITEPSGRPTADHVHNCDLMKRLRKKVKKSRSCVPVL